MRINEGFFVSESEVEGEAPAELDKYWRKFVFPISFLSGRLHLRRVRMFRFAISVAFFAAIWSRSALAQGPSTRPTTIAEVAALFPVLDTNANPLESFGFRGEMLGQRGVTFNVAFDPDRGPDLRLFDARDGTPIMLAVGDELVVYDSFHGTVWIIHRASVFFRLEPTKAVDGIDFEFSFSGSREPWVRSIDIRADPAAMIELMLPIDQPVIAGGNLRWVGKKVMGDRAFDVELKVNTDGSPATLELVVTNAQTQAVAVRMAGIQRGQQLEEQRFNLPDFRKLQDAIQVEVRNRSEVAPAELGSLLFGMGLRWAIHDEKLRKEIETQVGPVNWDELRTKDEQISKVLREWLKNQR